MSCTGRFNFGGCSRLGRCHQASSVAMPGQSVLTATPRRGVLRLVVLALTLVGFAALHGFGSVAGDGAHCGSAPALRMVADTHGSAESFPPDHHATTPTTHDGGPRADSTTSGHNSDDVTTGCLLALFGALVLVGLRLLRRFAFDITSPRVRHASAWLKGARAPPDPLFLSLCVFRL